MTLRERIEARISHFETGMTEVVGVSDDDGVRHVIVDPARGSRRRSIAAPCPIGCPIDRLGWLLMVVPHRVDGGGTDSERFRCCPVTWGALSLIHI